MEVLNPHKSRVKASPMLINVKKWNAQPIVALLVVSTLLVSRNIEFAVESYAGLITIKLPDTIHRRHLDDIAYLDSDRAYYDNLATRAGVETPW